MLLYVAFTCFLPQVEAVHVTREEEVCVLPAIDGSDFVPADRVVCSIILCITTFVL